MSSMVCSVVFGAGLCVAFAACGSPATAAPGTAGPQRAGTAKSGTAPGANNDADAGARSSARSDYAIEELSLTVQPAMAIRGQAPATELQARLSTAIPRLVAHAYASGLQLAGPPFVRYPDLESPGDVPGDPIAFEAGVPVLKPGAGTGNAGEANASNEIVAIELPAGPAIATVHTGAYENLPRARRALAAWARARGRVASGPPWEVFLTNPLQDPDPRTWRTKVFLPLEPAK